MMPDERLTADFVRIQWEGGLRVDDPRFWGCAGCKALYQSEEALKEHVKRESDRAEENRQLRLALKRLIDGPESGGQTETPEKLDAAHNARIDGEAQT